jgi:dual specificity phosphatase 12
MTDVEMETKYLVVIGMNRPRLNKIMALVDEGQSAEIEARDSVATLCVKLVPCLAAMGSYADENGNSVRYLSNVVYHDGSPMTTYFDDPSFRETLDSVLMVGYEWQTNGDKDKIEAYFKANQLEISVQCVNPNKEFDNLQDEMEAFKALDDDAKQQCLVDGSMGPAKMAKAVVDSIYQIKKVKADAIRRDKEEADIQRAVESTPATNDEAEESKQEHKPQHDPADPTRPRYACRMCRTILFGENHLAQDHIQNRHTFKKMNQYSTPANNCQSLFCSDDVLQWLSPSGEDIEGKLTCPRCSHKIGHWKWAGAQCSCGTWVTPAIQIPASKVDVVAPVPTNAGTGLVGVINPIILPSDSQ